MGMSLNTPLNPALLVKKKFTRGSEREQNNESRKDLSQEMSLSITYTRPGGGVRGMGDNKKKDLSY